MPTLLTDLLRVLWRLWQRLLLRPLSDPPALRPTMPQSPLDQPPTESPNAEPDKLFVAEQATPEPEATPDASESVDEERAGGDAPSVGLVQKIAQDEGAVEEASADEPTASPNGVPATPAAPGILPAPAIPEPLLKTEAGEMALTAVLESLLFVAEAPVAAAQIAPLLDLPVEDVETGLRLLAEQYEREGRGLRIQTRDGECALVSAPTTATLIERFLSLDLTTKLSGPALETLAIVAYRQPVTRAQVEAVRGVDCSGMLRSLVQRGLVEEMGHVEAVGRPRLYGVTDFFMNHFGLTEMGELPPLAVEDADALQAALSLEEAEADG